MSVRTDEHTNSMNILFINPKPSESYTVNGPSLGLCYLSAFLKERGIRSIEGIDLNIDSPETLEPAIAQANIVGVYCSTKAFQAALEVAKIAKRAQKTVVFGGPHASVLPEEVLRHPEVDYVILSEGETSFMELVLALDGKGELSAIDGFGYKENGSVKINPRPLFIRNLDTIPFPDRALFRFDMSQNITFCATRGCPYKCANCQPALSLQTCAFRTRSVENVLDELRLVGQGKYVHFVDNDLTVNRKWIRRLCEGILSEGIRIRWDCQGRVNTLSKDLMALMKKAGCIAIGLGIESGSQTLLDGFLKKQINLRQAEKIFADAIDVRMPLHGWFIIGIPTETREDIEKTIDFALTRELASVGFSIGTPWPGTDFYRISAENQWILAMEWGEFNEKRLSRLRTPHWGPEDIAAYREDIIRRFREKHWLVNENDFIFSNPFWGKGPVRRTVKKIRLGWKTHVSSLKASAG